MSSIQSITVQAPPPAVAAASKAATSGNMSARVASAEKPVVQELTSKPVTQTSAAEQKQQLADAVKAVKDFIQPTAGNLEFTLDEETGDTVIKIVDTSSGELIRQIPSQEMLEIAKALDRLQGLLVRQKA